MKNIKQKKCKNCKGKGYVPVYFMMASRARGIEDCPVCKGTGKIETEIKEKRIEELEEKISILLSCKDCPENKGGLICQKEYENKCLAQKIQFIKELQQENAELRTKTAALENANREMVKGVDDMTSGGLRVLENVVRSKEQLTKAKEIINNCVHELQIILLHKIRNQERIASILDKTEQFLKEIDE